MVRVEAAHFGRSCHPIGHIWRRSAPLYSLVMMSAVAAPTARKILEPVFRDQRVEWLDERAKALGGAGISLGTIQPNPSRSQGLPLLISGMFAGGLGRIRNMIPENIDPAGQESSLDRHEGLTERSYLNPMPPDLEKMGIDRRAQFERTQHDMPAAYQDGPISSNKGTGDITGLLISYECCYRTESALFGCCRGGRFCAGRR
jgi:hypothetical protein